MKYAKMLGLLAVAAAALMAFAGTASATELTTSDDGGKTHHKLVVGNTIHAVNNGVAELDGTINVVCSKSTVQGSVTNGGGGTETVKGSISVLTFEECGKNTVVVEQKGTLEIHTDINNSQTFGLLTSSGATVTVLTHNILGTIHCNYITNNTTIGTFTESDHRISTGEPETATIHIDSVPIPQESTDFGCGSNAEWTGTYDIDAPMHLDIH